MDRLPIVVRRRSMDAMRGTPLPGKRRLLSYLLAVSAVVVAACSEPSNIGPVDSGITRSAPVVDSATASGGRNALIVGDFSNWPVQQTQCGGWNFEEPEWRITARCRGAVARTVVEPPLSDFDMRVQARKIGGDEEAWYGLVVAATADGQRFHHRFSFPG
jgi:hypothetical protein